MVELPNAEHQRRSRARRAAAPEHQQSAAKLAARIASQPAEPAEAVEIRAAIPALRSRQDAIPGEIRAAEALASRQGFGDQRAGNDAAKSLAAEDAIIEDQRRSLRRRLSVVLEPHRAALTAWATELVRETVPDVLACYARPLAVCSTLWPLYGLARQACRTGEAGEVRWPPVLAVVHAADALAANLDHIFRDLADTDAPLADPVTIPELPPMSPALVEIQAVVDDHRVRYIAARDAEVELIQRHQREPSGALGNAVNAATVETKHTHAKWNAWREAPEALHAEWRAAVGDAINAAVDIDAVRGAFADAVVGADMLAKLHRVAHGHGLAWAGTAWSPPPSLAASAAVVHLLGGGLDNRRHLAAVQHLAMAVAREHRDADDALHRGVVRKRQADALKVVSEDQAETQRLAAAAGFIGLASRGDFA